MARAPPLFRLGPRPALARPHDGRRLRDHLTQFSDSKLDALPLHREDYAFVGATSLLRRQPLRREPDAASHVLLDAAADLPLDRCFEIHLSGCEIAGDRFFDLHHGVLLDAQLALLARLLELCPNARAVTYEDPVLDEAGGLAPGTVASFEALRGAMGSVPRRTPA